jgi:hypothetical protein
VADLPAGKWIASTKEALKYFARVGRQVVNEGRVRKIDDSFTSLVQSPGQLTSGGVAIEDQPDGQGVAVADLHEAAELAFV